MSELEHKIDIEIEGDDPEVNDIKKIVCSPNLDYITAWGYAREIDIIYIYSLKGREGREYEGRFKPELPLPLGFDGDGDFIDLLDISDQKHIVLKACYDDHKNEIESLVLFDANVFENEKRGVLLQTGNKGTFIGGTFVTNEKYNRGYVLIKEEREEVDGEENIIATGYLFSGPNWK
ncbi:6113_t:CDS:2 [Acaulospora colombiana]|uniref:6113_t:CDS:1 n=1 Tax=Acaulospora colombiana TaxID=27376 RepID=A0ACA9JWX6_9GLOM|nr:6113_t:CDS:2 [Acaulospora colombiana]